MTQAFSFLILQTHLIWTQMTSLAEVTHPLKVSNQI